MAANSHVRASAKKAKKVDAAADSKKARRGDRAAAACASADSTTPHTTDDSPPTGESPSAGESPPTGESGRGTPTVPESKPAPVSKPAPHPKAAPVSKSVPTPKPAPVSQAAPSPKAVPTPKAAPHAKPVPKPAPGSKPDPAPKPSARRSAQPRRAPADAPRGTAERKAGQTSQAGQTDRTEQPEQTSQARPNGQADQADQADQASQTGRTKGTRAATGRPNATPRQTTPDDAPTSTRPTAAPVPAPTAAPSTAPSPGTADKQPTRYDYDRYSQLAGPLTDPPAGEPYRVRYRSLLAQEPHRVRAALLLAAAPAVSALLLVWLLRPEHWVHRTYVSRWVTTADAVMLVSIGLIEVFRLFTVVSNAHATLVARDPVPVRAAAGTKVAFLTSFVPGKEPVAMVRATLAAATRLRHAGTLDVWLLDEGDDPEVKELCAALGVRHFSRKGVARWNQPTGPFRARTKHGNYNSWLDAHGDAYEFMACVDTDHVPLPNFLERMLGYFRDPDVAFVVGPQVYGNYDAAVTKAAESQQFLFHALIQRAGNAYDGAMFVGTNNAVRISALKGIGGLYDSITEDMATGFELHRTRNPQTGHKWRSVYTPDVLAVGEGPVAWADFFSQQLRWSRGTYETLFKQYWRGIPTLPPGRLLNYSLLLTFYPMSALNWVLSALSCTLFLGLGASGVQISSEVWLMLYSDAAALQIGLYLWNRKHNVSPHEPRGSSGTAGMALSAISAPIYAKSLCDAVLRRKSRFVVTPKGDSSSPDRLATFRIHLLWGLVFGGSLVAAPFLGHTHVAMCTWALLAVLLCLAAPAVWCGGLLRARRTARRGTAALPAARGTGQDGNGQDGTGQDGTGQSGAGQDGAPADAPPLPAAAATAPTTTATATATATAADEPAPTPAAQTTQPTTTDATTAERDSLCAT